MGVPRDVEARCGCVQGVSVYDMDDLHAMAEEHRGHRAAAIPGAEQVVSRACHRYDAWLESLAVVPTIVALRERFESIRAEEVRMHLGKVPGLDEVGARRIEQLTEAIVNRALHVPISRLKKRAGDGMGEVLAGCLRYLFALDEPGEER
jgi:glutamyl-tRNA reductase